VALISKMSRYKLGFGNQCLLALILGVVFGLIAPQPWVIAIVPLGSAYLQLLQMIIIPIAFVLIVNSFSQVQDLSAIRTLSLHTLFWFLTTAVIAASIGVFIASWLDPGQGFSASMQAKPLTAPPSISHILLDIVPGNLFAQASQGKVVPIIIFSVLFAIALVACKQQLVVIQNIFADLAKIMMKITRWIIRLSPIAILVFAAHVTAQYGISSLIPFAKFIVTVYLACILQFLVYAILLRFIANMNPVQFAKAAWPMWLTAFTTCSSLATLPLIVDTLLKKLHLPESVVSFVAPLGVNAKMDGCGAIYPAVVCIFTASLLHIPLTWQHYLFIILTSSIATIGTSGVPGSAIVISALVLSSIGLPPTGLAIVIGIDKLVDMIRTALNVTGTAVCAVLIAHQKEQLHVERS
jgi:Na+/H+-dicarboxylate symporter